MTEDPNAEHELMDAKCFADTGEITEAVGEWIARSVTFHGRNYFASPMIVPGGAGISVMVMK